MSESKILILLGTKAQFVKMAPVLLELDQRKLPYTLVYSGQHSETFDAMERAFGTRAPDFSLIPDYEADTHFSFAAWCLKFWFHALKARMRRLWARHAVIVVHGDTASTLFGALLGRLFGARVAHIEAGLRAPRLFDPFPEELIRRWVSRLAGLHFCPNEWACSNLKSVSGKKIDTGGNTLFDSLLLAHSELERSKKHDPSDPPANQSGFGIVSIHRNENLSRASRFGLLMETIARASSVVPLKFVLHPATRKRLEQSDWMASLKSQAGIELVPRMDYFRFIELMSSASFILTDGGSNQEEAAQLGIPCLLLRKSTERRDGLQSNVELSRLDPEHVMAFVERNRHAQWRADFLTPLSSRPSRVIVESLEAETAG